MDLKSENARLKRENAQLKFIVQDLIYIKTEKIVDDVKYINIRGPCVKYQKNALKQIYKHNNRRKESVYNRAKKRERCREQKLVYYGKHSLYHGKKGVKSKSWTIIDSLSEDVLKLINFKQYGEVFYKNLSIIPIQVKRNRQLKRWLTTSFLD